MKLEFEIWYQEKVTNKDALDLFSESCLCYKIGAYRAAFLMSYLGFQNILKERLLKIENPPQGIPQPLWDRTIEDLLKDDKWDEAVFDNVNRTLPNNPFLIGDDLRKQYVYFKCIRNDCAHAKSNIISSSHVETFWLFIQSNYSKFVVNGGRDGLLERIKIHYDPVYTKPGSDITPIVEDIITSMPVAEIPAFLRDVYALLQTDSLFCTFRKDEIPSDFWKTVVFSSCFDLKDSLYKFIKTDWNIFLEFINEYPNNLIEILSGSSQEFVRQFWNERIFEMVLGNWYYNNWNIVEKVIKTKIIPTDELSNFIIKLAKKAIVLPEEKLEFWKSIGYFDEVKRKVFGRGINFNAPNGIDYGNHNWTTIKFLLLNVDLDYEMVSQLNSALVVSSYGTFHDGLLNLLEANLEIKNKYKEILTQHLLSIPLCIKDSQD